MTTAHPYERLVMHMTDERSETMTYTHHYLGVQDHEEYEGKLLPKHLCEYCLTEDAPDGTPMFSAFSPDEGPSGICGPHLAELVVDTYRGHAWVEECGVRWEVRNA